MAVKLVPFLLFLCFSLAWAAPSTDLLDSCASGEVRAGIKMSQIEPQEYSEAEYGGFSSTVFTFEGKPLGVAHRKTEQGIVYAGKVYPSRSAERVNLSEAEFADMASHSGIDLDQPLDWYALRDKDGKQYVCAALNRSMQRATPVVFALDTGKQRKLFFYVGRAR